MNQNLIKVCYSYEKGNEKLPRLVELISEVEDSEKAIILAYLQENCIAVNAGMPQKDIINSAKEAGYGDIYCDDKYYWDDNLTYYVKEYNIPLPAEFKNYIIKNYAKRKKLHLKCNMLEKINIKNNPYLGYSYSVEIQRNGVVKYQNNISTSGESLFLINANDAQYIICKIFKQLYCYDVENRGSKMIDGYSWKVDFYDRNHKDYSTTGATGEPVWRYDYIKSSFEFVERYINKDMGSSYMLSSDR